MAAYVRGARHPRGSSTGQDIMESGLLPADSDFRMYSYRHYGSLPGMDISYLLDGASYHTDRDTAARLTPGCVQVCHARSLAGTGQLRSRDQEEASQVTSFWGIFREALEAVWLKGGLAMHHRTGGLGMCPALCRIAWRCGSAFTVALNAPSLNRGRHMHCARDTQQCHSGTSFLGFGRDIDRQASQSRLVSVCPPVPSRVPHWAAFSARLLSAPRPPGAGRQHNGRDPRAGQAPCGARSEAAANGRRRQRHLLRLPRPFHGVRLRKSRLCEPRLRPGSLLPDPVGVELTSRHQRSALLVRCCTCGPAWWHGLTTDCSPDV
jgi:hypothetical protein